MNKKTLIISGVLFLTIGFLAGAYFKVIPTYAIDNDQDGQINILDNDDDNDAVLDTEDSKPLDHDNDSLDDEVDTDDDNDSKLDDEDESLFDNDNDGVEDEDEPEVENESEEEKDNSGSGGNSGRD